MDTSTWSLGLTKGKRYQESGPGWGVMPGHLCTETLCRVVTAAALPPPPGYHRPAQWPSCAACVQFAVVALSPQPWSRAPGASSGLLLWGLLRLFSTLPTPL